VPTMSPKIIPFISPRDLDCSVSCRQRRGYQLGKSVSLVVPDLPML